MMGLFVRSVGGYVERIVLSELVSNWSACRWISSSILTRISFHTHVLRTWCQEVRFTLEKTQLLHNLGVSPLREVLLKTTALTWRRSGILY